VAAKTGQVVVAHEDDAVHTWQLSDVTRDTRVASVKALAVATDGSRLLLAQSSGISLWTQPRGGLVGKNTEVSARSAASLSDGTWLVGGSDLSWLDATGKVLRTQPGHQEKAKDAKLSNDIKAIVVAGNGTIATASDLSLRLWTASGTVLSEQAMPDFDKSV